MSRRPPLPPPPPPVELRSWPGHAAMLADRAAVLSDLGRRSLGGAALAVFWLLVAGAQLGWGVVGLALTSDFAGLAPFGVLLRAALGAIGVGVMAAPVIILGLSARRQRRTRSLMDQWAALASDPAGAPRLRMAGASLSWLLTSFASGTAGLWLALVVPATARAGEDTYGAVAYAMGAGTLLWLAALTGAARAVRHYRWAIRL
ncbi:hypothetical protein [Streptomyces paludis]|uniref:Uncharacterized protein n=1 Tax=Streptomyces paludis TaxID=2282738 RepID=A0A345HST7_9ACTN|nr:hypothetical protein [Streptomyces paludis]AXG79761.1 hypothetical protein DVK44_21270 [Streptomyces paludis]